jgi:hypothetical protein
VWDLIFRTGGRLTLGAAQVRVLACGFHNLRDARQEAAPADREALRGTVWAQLAGGPLCAVPYCLCFVDYQWTPCRNPRGVVAAWHERGTTDAATLAALGFGAAEVALLALDDADSTTTSEEGNDAA